MISIVTVGPAAGRELERDKVGEEKLYPRASSLLPEGYSVTHPGTSPASSWSLQDGVAGREAVGST